MYLEYTNNSQNSLIKKKKKLDSLKKKKIIIWYNEQKIWTDTLPVRETKSKDESLWKCKLKPLWEWGKLKKTDHIKSSQGCRGTRTFICC